MDREPGNPGTGEAAPAWLAPPDYLESLARHLEAAEKEAWDWIAGDLAGPEHAERARLEILKSTFRIERDLKPGLYAAASEALARLGIAAPVTFYQMQEMPGMNAALFFMPGEIHVALSGPVTEKLGPSELAALVGHEAGHFALLEGFGRRFRVLEEVMSALVAGPSPQPAHERSQRLMRLHSEVFCDRASLAACGSDLLAAVGSLVKTETGMADASAESLLRQTDEIFEKDDPGSRGQSHPETFIRVRALKLHADRDPGAEGAIRRMIEGGLAIGGMDLLGRVEMGRITRAAVDAMLAEKWIRSPSVMAHARMFFDGYEPPAAPPDLAALGRAAAMDDADTARYFAYVLLDFAACDRDMGEPALAAALSAASALGVADQFRTLAMKELGIGRRGFDAIEADRAGILEAARKRQEAGP